MSKLDMGRELEKIIYLEKLNISVGCLMSLIAVSGLRNIDGIVNKIITEQDIEEGWAIPEDIDKRHLDLIRRVSQTETIFRSRVSEIKGRNHRIDKIKKRTIEERTCNVDIITFGNCPFSKARFTPGIPDERAFILSACENCRNRKNNFI